ncbi:MAG TPA: alpha/beta hydrolase, partial [Mycobacterium sp.]|nr:alpha/beta hydrolase [Mycobacterium sp.]
MPSPSATQPTVAKTTRVCAYDRPYTRPDGPERSTPVPQPHTVQHDVNDLVKLVAGAKLSTPLVVAADSYGGLVADLLARTYPPNGEGFLAEDAFRTFKAAPLFPKVPAIVLSSDKFPPPTDLAPQHYTKFQI